MLNIKTSAIYTKFQIIIPKEELKIFIFIMHCWLCEVDFYPGTYGDYTSHPCSEDHTLDPLLPLTSKQKRQLQKLHNAEQQDYYGTS